MKDKVPFEDQEEVATFNSDEADFSGCAKILGLALFIAVALVVGALFIFG